MTDVKTLAQKAEQYAHKLERIEAQMRTMSNVLPFLDEVNPQVLIPLAPGVFYDKEQNIYLLNVGKHIFVEKSKDAIKSYLNDQLKLHEEYHDALTSQLMRLLEEAERV